jgi:hypothetical protein
MKNSEDVSDYVLEDVIKILRFFPFPESLGENS